MSKVLILSYQNLLFLESENEKTQIQIMNLKVKIIRESEILPNIPTGYLMVEIFKDQEVTPEECQHVEEISKYLKQKFKIQKLQKKLDELCKKSDLLSFEITKLREEIKNI
jgi:hypothetical protein